MDNEVYTFALKNTLNEIQNACPDITNTFVFGEDGEIIAGDEKTSEKTMVHVVDAFEGIFEKADAIGGLECITIDGSNGRVNVSWLNDLYFVTVTSKKADMNYVNTVTRVLIPTVLRLIEKICPTPLKSNSPVIETKRKLEVPTDEEFEKPEPVVEPIEETVMEERKETLEAETNPEPLLIEPPVSQLIVENPVVYWFHLTLFASTVK